MKAFSAVAVCLLLVLLGSCAEASSISRPVRKTENAAVWEENEPLNVSAEALSALVTELSDVAAGAYEAMAARGLTDIYSEQALAAAAQYLEDCPDVVSYTRAGSGLVYCTQNGMLGGIALDDYAPGVCGTPTDQAEEAFKVFQKKGSLPENELILTDFSMTNPNVSLVVFDPSNSDMNLLQSMDQNVLSAYRDQTHGDFAYYANADAREALTNGTLTDVGLLVIGAHGMPVKGHTYLNIGKFASGSALPDFIPAPGESSWYRAVTVVFDEHGGKKDIVYHFYSDNSFDVRVRAGFLAPYFEGKTFDNTVVVLGVCFAAADQDLINLFLNHGAAAVVAGTETVSIYHHSMALYLLTAETADAQAALDYWNAVHSDEKVIVYTAADVRSLGEALSTRQDIRSRLDRSFNNVTRLPMASLAASIMTDPDPDNETILIDRLYNFYNNSPSDGYSTLEVYGDVERYLTGAYPLRGTVTEDGKLVPYAKVTAYRFMNHSFEKVAETATNREGAYELSGLPFGLYVLHAEKNGVEGVLGWEHIQDDAPAEPIELKLIQDVAVYLHEHEIPDALTPEYLSIYLLDKDGQRLLNAEDGLVLFCGQIPSDELRLAAERADMRLRIWRLPTDNLFVELAYEIVAGDEDSEVIYSLYHLQDGELARVKYAHAECEARKLYCYEGDKRASGYDTLSLSVLNDFFREENIRFAGWSRLAHFWSEDFALAVCTDGKLLFDSARPEDAEDKLFYSYEAFLSALP